ncbi:transmembrane efflux protein [Streptomyces davaonensis JCM 4913]|uniref:Transmembrane efflux protein n=1 Tax=Streptomyces davaonensis (strain DSM 101723 / JCM 4913 / KCC S-0913 / 768) TaxID=1214101 RepID=K4QZB8_STRDJ|nr:MFS transporter [Streptomyces davaonensis]CCK26200.1 transmembrane efflux protein [Streptomyces davaonensis JCM 4913]
MNPRLTLAASVAGAVIVALDGTVLTMAQPALQRDLGASHAQVQWTSTGYLVAVASLLVFGGRLGDRFGHHRLFAVGMLGFGAASAGIGLASGIGTVIGLRVAQGVFGALLQPATLGMLRTAYPPDRLRTPIAVRTAAIGVAAAAGPLVGGALVAGPGWRAVFFLNVLPALVFGVLALAVRAPHPKSLVRLDLPGALLLAATLATLVHALVALPEQAPVLLVTAVTGTLFLRHERRTTSPLLPPDVIGTPAVGAALGTLAAASAALSGTLFVATYLLQDTLGLDPLRTALHCLPLAVLMVAAAPCCAVLLRRVGARRTTLVALAVLGAGILLLSRASDTLGLCTGFGLLGAGFGTVMVAATHVVVREAAAESAGVAGGLQQTAMNVGPVLGVAAATTLMGAHGGDRLPLTVLALLAAAGMMAARALPGRFSSVDNEPGDPRDRTRVPARR